MCDEKNVSLVSEDRILDLYSAVNILSLAEVEYHHVHGKANYWAPKLGSTGEFVLDLGCIQSFKKIRVVNTHNGKFRDRSAKNFRQSNIKEILLKSHTKKHHVFFFVNVQTWFKSKYEMLNSL